MKNHVVIPALCISLGLLVGCQRDDDTPDTTDTSDTVTTQTPRQPATQPQTTSPPPVTPPAQSTPQTAQTSQPGQVHVATGTVTLIDSQSKRITVDHDPVTSLNWPAMTMTFDVRDGALLQDLQQGDEVRFAFTRSGDNMFVISEIEESTSQSERISQGEE